MTPTDISNMALDILKEAPISDISDGRPISNWLNRNFATTRDALLERADWNFAMVRQSVASDSDTPIGWSYAYSLPADCIRVCPLTYLGQTEGRLVQHEVERRRILTNAPSPIYIRYVSRSEDYDAYPATFVEALAARLAMKMAHWLTGKSNFASIAENMYKDAMNSAWLSDAMQGTSPRAADDEWVDAR
jgi:hypothetical protein